MLVKSKASKIISGENYIDENPHNFSFSLSILIVEKNTFAAIVIRKVIIDAIFLFL